VAIPWAQLQLPLRLSKAVAIGRRQRDRCPLVTTHLPHQRDQDNTLKLFINI
jgi:hypothetical protein